MIWKVKRIEAQGEVAQVQLTAGKYKDPGYATMDLVVRLSEVPKYPLGSTFSTGNLVPVEGRVQ
jgi:hypothetical protein